MSIISAVGASLLEEQARSCRLRITFLVEGEDGRWGALSLSPAFLEKYAGRPKEADFVYLSDTALPEREPGGRDPRAGGEGRSSDLVVTGAKGDLHSGLLRSGVLRNPIQALAEICAAPAHPRGRCGTCPASTTGVLWTWSRGRGRSSRSWRATGRPTWTSWGSTCFYTTPGFSPFESVPSPQPRPWNSTGSEGATRGVGRRP